MTKQEFDETFVTPERRQEMKYVVAAGRLQGMVEVVCEDYMWSITDDPKEYIQNYLKKGLKEIEEILSINLGGE